MTAEGEEGLQIRPVSPWIRHPCTIAEGEEEERGCIGEREERGRGSSDDRLGVGADMTSSVSLD